MQSQNKVYFYFTRYIIPGNSTSEAASIGLIYNLVRHLPSGVNAGCIVLSKLFKE